jgi:N-dimethylarginine dimethylaminohydrolase
MPRSATPRHYVMCRPDYFDVVYSINPWMDPERPTDNLTAIRQWETLRELYLELGHRVSLVPPLPGLPDMVYAANGATVVDGMVLGARFRNVERSAEGPAYLDWFREQGFARYQSPEYINEGEGDLLITEHWILAGNGFRSELASHQEAQEFFGRPVVSLQLVDPRYYHLDTALAVLSGDEITYNPQAFSPGSLAVLRRLFPDAILAEPEDAEVFALNAVSDGYNVVLPSTAATLAGQLKEREFNPIGVDMSELLKGGGGAKCCTLEVRT